MRNINLIAITLFAVSALAFSGCGGNNFATVSGTVTYEGEPVPKLSVVFSPEPVGDNHTVGPFSDGVTDTDGKFTLTTRYGDPGAVVGNHTVAFEYTDIGETAMQDLRDEMADAQEEGSEEEFEAVKKKLEKMKAKLKGRPLLESKYPAIIEIPAGGVADLKLELTEMTEK